MKWGLRICSIATKKGQGIRTDIYFNHFLLRMNGSSLYFLFQHYVLHNLTIKWILFFSPLSKRVRKCLRENQTQVLLLPTRPSTLNLPLRSKTIPSILPFNEVNYNLKMTNKYVIWCSHNKLNWKNWMSNAEKVLKRIYRIDRSIDRWIHRCIRLFEETLNDQTVFPSSFYQLTV